MNKEQLTQVVNTIANGELVNTTNDVSLSIQETQIGGWYHGRVVVYPMQKYPYFCAYVAENLLAIGNVFGVSVRFDVEHGAAVCVIS